MNFPQTSLTEWLGRAPPKFNFYNVETSALSCLAFLIHLRGIGITLGEVFSASLFPSPFSKRAFYSSARRLGLHPTSIPFSEIYTLPALGVLESGYTYILLHKKSEVSQLLLPGFNESVNEVSNYSDLILRAEWYCFSYSRPRRRTLYTPALKSPLMVSDAGTSPHSDLMISVDDLICWNGDLDTNNSKVYGVLRVKQLRRLNCEYHFPTKIRAALNELVLAGSRVNQIDEWRLPHFLICLFLDFCAIHPFLNGNGRIAAKWVLTIAKHRGYSFDLKRIPRAEFYFWVGALHRRKRISHRLVSEIVSRLGYAKLVSCPRDTCEIAL
jgi:hypothetical protein